MTRRPTRLVPADQQHADAEFANPEDMVTRAVERASHFVMRMWLGRATGYCRIPAATLGHARAVAPLLERVVDNNRRVCIYAISPEGVATFVPPSFDGRGKMTSINYKVVTTYRCLDGGCGVSTGYQDAECTADAMRQERERIADACGPIEVEVQHADVSAWHLKRLRNDPLVRYAVRADHARRVYEVYDVATGETVKAFRYRASSELERGRALGQATIERDQLLLGGDHA